MRIAVVDGQGGGVGKALIERIRQRFAGRAHIIALGTNSMATASMLRAGADEAATGENAVRVNAPGVAVIMGAVGIVAADSMLGEITPAIARAVGQSPAAKILLPVNRCRLTVAGVKDLPFADYIAEAVEALQTLWEEQGNTESR